MDKYRKMAVFFGIFLSVISAIFTCQLLLKFADTGLSKLVFVAMGIGIQCVQTLTITMAAWCVFQGKMARAVPAFVIYLLLLLLSFAGTMGSLSSENKEINDQAKINSQEYQIINSQIADIDSQIAFVKQTITDCSARSIISKCVTPKTAELNDLLAEKKSLQASLLNLSVAYAGDELFRRIGEFMGCSADQAKSLIYLLYSFALDLGAACLLAYSAGLLAFKEKDIWAHRQGRKVRQSAKDWLWSVKKCCLLCLTRQRQDTVKTQDRTESLYKYSTVLYRGLSRHWQKDRLRLCLICRSKQRDKTVKTQDRTQTQERKSTR
jgi:hypothetical protein